ncbi:hypothetical protein ANO11243_000930 [Dothideomycetidae sp. 11243]|nr:hypothetical protein ANO11243_000930 [fungal sp. No.11243]
MNHKSSACHPAELDAYAIDEIRPSSGWSHSKLVPETLLLKDIPDMPPLPFAMTSEIKPPSNTSGSSRGPQPAELQHHHQGSGHSPVDDAGSFDLRPPPPKQGVANAEELAIKFFSAGHLNIILRHQQFSRRFSSFIQRYKPELLPVLHEYLAIQKVATAVEYANAISERISDSKSSHPPLNAFDDHHEHRGNETVQQLVDEALPGFLTHRLAQIVTETLVKEITGQGTPLMRDMIPSLAEVYCVSDPSLPDNPIVYASEEFYNTSQYGKDYVIGRNCRFLQGPKTSGASVARLVEALTAGEEINETILN